MRPLTLEKTLQWQYEWAEDETPLVRSEYSSVTLGWKDAQVYLEMAEALDQVAAMQQRAMSDEFDNLVSTAKDEWGRAPSRFETYVSTSDVQVRRADSVVVSLLSDSYSDYGAIENYRAFHGTNYDTQSGKELALNEVVTVNNDLAKAVEKELDAHTWTADFYSASAVEDYFANTPYDGFSWTVDYIGVTFYFMPGDLSDDGAMTATVTFAEYPELFSEKYMVTPTAYTVELPQDISFFCELDDDEALEAISVSAQYDAERNRYTDYGIYTDTDGNHYEAACDVNDIHPYYVKAASGHYLYLFLEEHADGARQMQLVVFSLNKDGSITKLGERELSPEWVTESKFTVPTDPRELVLEGADTDQNAAVFTVGSDGMPRQ